MAEINLKYVLKRLLYAIPAILLVIVIIFFLTRVMPGDPARTYLGEMATQTQIDQLNEEWGLDKPIYIQFLNYIIGLCHGDFGYSWHTHMTVLSDFQKRFPASLELAIWAILIAILVGVPLGIMSAKHKNSPLDHAARIFSMLGSTMPVFWFGLMLILVLYAKLHWAVAPMGRISSNINPPTTVTGLFVLDSLLTGDMVALKDSAAHLILPALTLSMSSMAVLARMTRASMLEVLSQDYIRTARAKGMKEHIVINRHGLRNALIPILTVLGTQFGMMLGYTVVVETIFSWPGIGSYVTNSILNMDYNPVQAFALMSAVLYVMINLILDILYTVVDHRINYE
ncbi:Dipeptide transport system permease protein DppB [bioreactor metagenome]|uniref:Dipeptide transport system permease protein DppB n=1 Tax=bioreactor metagenome TaxID=1076179 RepID=A0A644ZRL4_9ZZZZ